MRDSTSYIIRFVLIMTVLVALVLASMQTFLEPIHSINEAVYQQRSVLLSVADLQDTPVNAMTVQEVQDVFDNQMEELVLDHEGNVIEGLMASEINLEEELKKPKNEQRYPLYIFEKDGEKYYIVSVRGQGLWDAIWGSIALESDMKTIKGASFDHAGETPGLGAEIKDNPAFPAQFVGKEIYDDNGVFTAVRVIKGMIRDPAHEVDGISGSTITSRGVQEMLYKGIQNYEPYFDKIRK